MPIEGRVVQSPVETFDRVLDRGLASKPDEIAIASAEGSATWRELDDLTTRLARGYQEHGLEPGARIASLMPNRVALAVHYIAAFKAGLVVTPLNYRYAAPEIDHALEVSGATALLAHAERADDLAASRLAGDVPLGVISYGDPGAEGSSYESLTAGPSVDTSPTAADPHSPAAI